MLQPIVEIAYRYAPVKMMMIDDVSKYALVVSIGNKNHLKILFPIFGNNFV